MGVLTITGLDPATEERLRARAAARGVSVEDEARQILSASVLPYEESGQSLLDEIRELFAPCGNLDDLVIPPRKSGWQPPTFG